MLNKKAVLSLNLSTGTYKSFLDNILDLAVQRQSSYTCVANVHMCIEAYKDEQYAALVNNADYITPDGMPLAKSVKLLYGEEQDRVSGMDLFPDLLKKAEKESLGVFFYGGSQEMLDKTKSFVKQKYAGISNHHYYSPPFRELTPIEETEIVQRMNSSGAHLVFVILGCPKQEKWMAAMKGRVNATMIGLGGALPVMIGMQKRAPQWMQNMSLEWLFRFAQEPKRLFKRYLVTNSMFMALLFKEWVLIKLKRSPLSGKNFTTPVSKNIAKEPIKVKILSSRNHSDQTKRGHVLLHPNKKLVKTG